MELDTTQALATAATLYGVGGALSVLFQARQMLVSRASRDVSLRFLAASVGGYAVWLLYGLGISSTPIVLVHASGTVCGAVTLTVAIRLRRSGDAGRQAVTSLADREVPAQAARVPRYRAPRCGLSSARSAALSRSEAVLAWCQCG